MKLKNTIVYLMALSVFGCATTDLDGGKFVSTNANEITKDCVELGFVYGRGGGFFGGLINKADLSKYAHNAMRNEAHELGATHVKTSLGNYSGGLWAATTTDVSGVAYKCPTKTGLTD